jgi:hypothetical protein
LPRHGLSELDADIIEDEIHNAIKQMLAEKAPGLDGYIGAFYKIYWDTIKDYLVGAVQQIFQLRAKAWELLNSANVALILKKKGAEPIADYRPISLMHSVAKIIGKFLANRLAPRLSQMTSPSQSAFIKGRSIHENFQYIQGTGQALPSHKNANAAPQT